MPLLEYHYYVFMARSSSHLLKCQRSQTTLRGFEAEHVALGYSIVDPLGSSFQM